MNTIELKIETVEDNELNAWNITKKAVKHFKKQYKENKKDLSLGDFMMYAIIKNMPLDITIYDSNYGEDKNPLDYHRKFISEISLMAMLDSSILTTFESPKHKLYHGQSPYAVKELLKRYQKLFGLTEEEIKFVITEYVTQRKTA